MTTEKKSLGIQEIMDLLPHRYPFLMVDKVENYEISDERKTLRAIKNVSFNEPITGFTVAAETAPARWAAMPAAAINTSQPRCSASAT